jgi:hypothetical protein
MRERRSFGVGRVGIKVYIRVDMHDGVTLTD